MFVLILENELVLNLLFNADNVDSVAPVGNGNSIMFVMFHVPLCTADTLSVPLAKRVKLIGTALALRGASVKPTLTDNDRLALYQYCLMCCYLLSAKQTYLRLLVMVNLQH